MRQIFRSDANERFFREYGFVVVDLLDVAALDALWDLYAESFRTRRKVVPYAEKLPYYISIFDADSNHKRRVDTVISDAVAAELPRLMLDYEVFYSNFMIKFPGDGQIEAHQDFNFVDESQHHAFNLWSPLVDTDPSNGGLFVIAGSHGAFRTQRGPNLPKALTQYNDLLRKYARRVPLRRGQALVFDHRLIHYSPPNRTEEPRVAVQSVLTPVEATKVHYVFHEPSRRVRAYRVDKEFILGSNLWEADLSSLELDHEQNLIPFPGPDEVADRLAELTVEHARGPAAIGARHVFRDPEAQGAFERDGFVRLGVLGPEEVAELRRLFVDSTGGKVENTAYGMYIGLEEPDLERKRALIRRISDLVLPRLAEHFTDCKPHLGSFLVKAPGEHSYTYPHQDWTFVDSPPYVSITVWIALVDTDEGNGTLGFLRGSHALFEGEVGSPSPEFRTSTQGHEPVLYEYLEFVPLRAGEALAFDNRTIHGATPNVSDAPRIAVAVGMTPREAQLYHYFLVPDSLRDGRRTVAKLRVDEEFFERYSVAALKALYDDGQIPPGYEVAARIEQEVVPFSSDEVRRLCERAGLPRNGLRLGPSSAGVPAAGGRAAAVIGSAVRRVRTALFGS